MTQQHLLTDLSVITVRVTFWTSVAYVLAVSTFWPWWKTDLGWTIILKTVAISLVLLPAELHYLLGFRVQSLPYQWLSLLSFAAVPVILVWRFAILWTIQRYNPPPVKSGHGEFTQAQRRRPGRSREDEV